PWPPRAADPSRLRRQEPPDRARRARPGAPRRGGRDRRGAADLRIRGGPPVPELRVMRDDLPPPRPRRHLLSIEDLTREDVERLLATARSFDHATRRELKKLPTLRGRTVVNLFFESSTRTSSSFELAAKRLSADVMSIKAAGSAVDKG